MTVVVQQRTPARWIEPAQLSEHDLTITDSPLLSAVLHARGIHTPDDARYFLFPDATQLGDPYLLPDIDRAVDLIRHAATTGKRITVFGDYDVDGLTATAVLVRVLRGLGADPIAIVPHRIDDGYGLSMPMIDRIASLGTELLVAVDCGSSNRLELEEAASRGIQCIVIDHHHYAGDLPDDVPFVSPRRPDNHYPNEHLAAVGVVWTLVRALVGDPDAETFLPYVALGTIADVVDLRGENRALVARGIERLRRWKLPGLMALCASAGIDQQAISTWDIGFIVAPRLNAAGRMASPQTALDLLLADDATTAVGSALKLSSLNSERQAETARVVREAEELLATMGSAEEQPAIVLAGDNWGPGIAGLVASRLAETYHRPAVVISRGPGISRGSARSVGPINLVEAIGACADLLDRFGGHQHAAGLTIATERIEVFSDALCATVLDMCGGRLPEREIVLDAEAHHDHLHLASVDVLTRLEPCGQGNKQPLFLVRGLKHRYVKTSRDGRHLLFQVTDERGRSHSAVFFGAGGRIDEMNGMSHIDLATTLRRDIWHGRTRLKLHVTDFRAATPRR